MLAKSRRHTPGIGMFGFVNQAREERYREYFYLTFAVNNRLLLRLVYTLLFPFHFGTLVRQTIHRDEVPFPTLAIQFGKCCLIAYLWYGFMIPRTIPHTVRGIFNVILRLIVFVIPALVVVEHTSRAFTWTTSAAHVFLWCFCAPFLTASWVLQTIGSLVVCWVPFLASMALSKSDSQFENDSGLYDAVVTAILGSVLGPIWCAWLQKNRREEYYASRLREHKEMNRKKQARCRSRRPKKTLGSIGEHDLEETDAQSETSPTEDSARSADADEDFCEVNLSDCTDDSGSEQAVELAGTEDDEDIRKDR